MKLLIKFSIGTEYRFDPNERPLDATHKDVYVGFYKDKFEIVTDIVEKEMVEKKTRIIRSERFNDCPICNGGGGSGRERLISGPTPEHFCEKGVRFILEDGREIIRYDQENMNIPHPFSGRIVGGYYIEDVLQWNYAGMQTNTSYLYIPVKGLLAVYTTK